MRTSAINRFPLAFAALVLLTVVVLCLSWGASLELGFGTGRSRVVHAWEIGQVTLAALGSLALAPRVLTWDLNGSASVGRATASWYSILAGCLLFTPLTSRAVLALRGPGDGLEESLPWVLAVAFSFTGLLTMGLTLLTMTLLGRWAGSIAGPLLVTSLWWVQGVDRARFWVPLHDSADLRYWPVLASLLVAAGGVRLSAKRATRRLSA